MNIKQRKGISLIVLVITIIVMVILATAIILSLNGSGILGKASEARKASDDASKKEAAILKYAEYQLGIQTGDIDSSVTASEWVKEELEKDGIDTSDTAITDSGNIEVGLSEVAVKFVELGVQIGDVVTGYDLSSNTTTSYTTDGEEHTDPYASGNHIPTSQTITRASNLVWRYMGIDENGDALIVADSTGDLTNITLSGKGAVLNGESTLDTVCRALYSSEMGTARSIDYNDVTRLIKYDGPEGTYQTCSDDEMCEYTLEVKTKEALTVGEIQDLYSGFTFDASLLTLNIGNIYDVKSDYVGILKTSEHIHADEKIKSVVFQTTSYFLASVQVLYNIRDYDDINWIFPSVTFDGIVSVVPGSYTDYVWRGVFANMYEDGSTLTRCFRPVILLNSSVDVSYNGTSATLS